MSIGKCCPFRILRRIVNHTVISLFGTVALLLYFCMMGAASEHDAIGVAIVRHRGCANSERPHTVVERTTKPASLDPSRTLDRGRG